MSLNKYMRAIGFNRTESIEESRRITAETVRHNNVSNVFKLPGGEVFAEFVRYYAPGIGVSVCGYYEGPDNFCPEYCLPFVKTQMGGSREPVRFTEHSWRRSFAGTCDESSFGTVCIFHLINISDYMKASQAAALKGIPFVKTETVHFSGLSLSGKVLLPVYMSETERDAYEDEVMAHQLSVLAARKGRDEEIESLNLKELEYLDKTRKAIKKRDVYSIAVNCLAPAGVECDQYKMIADIVYAEKLKNQLSGEEFWKLSLECCGVAFSVCINCKDLLGEPKAGTRFSGTIWMQADVVFPGVNEELGAGASGRFSDDMGN